MVPFDADLGTISQRARSVSSRQVSWQPTEKPDHAKPPAAPEEATTRTCRESVCILQFSGLGSAQILANASPNPPRPSKAAQE